MTRWLGILAVTAIACAGCGGDSPAVPTSPTGGPAASVSQGARILGNVTAGETLAAMTAQVVGTSVSSPVGAGGGFVLDGVPAGPVQMRFVGSGVDAAVALSPVQPGDVVSVLVGVSGATAMLQAESRNTGGKVELEGRVEALPTTAEPDTFVIGGRKVTASAATQVRDGNNTAKTLADLVVGLRVHVKGTLVTEPTSAILADSIVIQNTNTWIPVNVNGILESLNEPPPTAPYTLNFKVGSRFIKGDLSTKIYGDNDAPLTPLDLKNGQRVEVKGEQGDNFVYAVRIHINGLTTTPPQDDSASVEGELIDISPAIPAKPQPITLPLTLKILPKGAAVATTVTATSATEVRRRGDVQTLYELAKGQIVHAVGTRMSSGTIEARMLQIKDDEANGPFVIEGSLGGLKGTCPAISFGVNGYSVYTLGGTPDPAPEVPTVFLPDGPDTCKALKSGTKVAVEGKRQANGSVLATKVTKK